MTLYIYVESNVWKLATEITEEIEEFNPHEIMVENVEKLIEFAKDQGAEDGDTINSWFDSNENDSYFVYSDEEWTVLTSNGDYFGYKTKEIPERI